MSRYQIVGLVTPWLLGMSLLIIIASSDLWKRGLVCFLTISAGVGIGVTSCLVFIWLVLFSGEKFENYLGLEIGVVLALSLAVFVLRRTRSFVMDRRWLRTPGKEWPYAVAFLVVLLARSAWLAKLGSQNPHGVWDAWITWNLRARFLFRGANIWREAVTAEVPNRDYPLLLPGFVARGWFLAGMEHAFIPLAISIGFTILTAVLLFSAVSIVRGNRPAFWGALVLLWTPTYCRNGASEYADVPLSFFFLVSIVLFHFYDEERSSHGFAILAGTAAALAAWTKNEGLLFVFCVVLACSFARKRTAAVGTKRVEVAWVLLGMVPVIVLIAFFKTFTSLTTAVFSGGNLGTMASNALSTSRAYTVIVQFVSRILTFGGWSWDSITALSPFPFVVAYVLLKRKTNGIFHQKSSWGAQSAIIVVGLMVFGYFVTFLITPRPVAWQMATACDRLLLQLWPSCLFIAVTRLVPPYAEPVHA